MSKDLKMGQKILYKRERTTGIGECRTYQKKGEICGIYPYIFLVKWDKGGWKEAFPKSILESTGRERVYVMEGGAWK